jgi:hypothetical protein
MALQTAVEVPERTSGEHSSGTGERRSVPQVKKGMLVMVDI